jgi:hypothetical protein
MNDIEEQIDKQDKFYPQIAKILNKNIHLFSSFTRATPKQDMEEGFDSIFTLPDIKIPIRMRGKYYFDTFRDITIRSKLDTGSRTEIDKIRDGCGDYYFYAWKTEKGNSFVAYVIFDINKFVKSGRIDKPSSEDVPNGDGTYLNGYDLGDLIEDDVLLIYEYLG